MKPVCRRRRTPVEIACAAVVASFAGPAFAQNDASDVRGVIKVEVTGSHIYRTDIETALPVQVITREDIERGGWISVAEIMSKLPANIGQFNDSLTVGNQLNDFPRPGLSSINLRGIGDGNTLVLINGRRVANYAFDGGTVDVNAIPVAAIERVEILKDGASAIYGTDAIAGVVNFILRKDYRGAEVSVYGNWTEHGGGNQYQATATAGFGDLASDRYNAFVTVSYQKNEALRPTDRDFARTGYRPGDDLFLLTGWTLPANIRGPHGLVNPSYASGCSPPDSFPMPAQFGPRCGFDPARYFDVIPETTRSSVLGRATYQANSALQVFAEAGYSYNHLTMTLPPPAVGGDARWPVYYPSGGPFYPVEFAAANGLSGDLDVLYRATPLGNRVNDVETQALRALVGFEGSAQGWDYGAAILYSENRQKDTLTNGYISYARLTDAFATGLINPFGASGPVGDALLASTTVTGDFHDAKGTTWLVDAKASRELARFAGSALAIALGAEVRHEKLANTYAPEVNSADVINIFEHFSVSASRNVQAFYAEASVPVAPGIETQLALRYDNYSDFGGTVNPKAAVRWQPVQSLLLRASWGTGYRAPTLYDLYTPLQHGMTAEADGSYGTDPIRCPVTGSAYDCGGAFPAVSGGNPHLQPETSRQINAGVVWAPTSGLSLGLDYWNIEKRNVITPLSQDLVLPLGAPFASTNVVRGPVDPRYPDLPGPIEYVVLWNENVDNLRTSGYDVDLSWRAPATSIGRFTAAFNGTYISTYTLGGYNISLAGNSDGPYAVPRWRHFASLNWSYGAWSATLTQSFQAGYAEYDTRYCDENGDCPRRQVGSYSLWSLQGQYTGLRRWTLTAGVTNLFAQDPPFAIFGVGRQTGFDTTYADPRGRSFYARVAYAFQ